MTEDASKILEETQTVYEEVQDYLRPAAKFFHENEGELFTRSEAADELVEELDISERIANNTLSQLVSDTVDPVVQVGLAGEQHVGVADFREFEGAYGYLSYHDIVGPRKRVVCQQCVNKATSDKEVTHATEKSQDPSASTFEQEADYDELLEKVHTHYEDVHSVVPEKVETGADLVSGTTMGDEQAWHQGNVSGGTGVTIGTQSITAHAQNHDNADHTTNMATSTELSNHEGDTTNPHSVDDSQTGAASALSNHSADSGAHHTKTTTSDIFTYYDKYENVNLAKSRNETFTLTVPHSVGGFILSATDYDAGTGTSWSARIHWYEAAGNWTMSAGLEIINGFYIRDGGGEDILIDNDETTETPGLTIVAYTP